MVNSILGFKVVVVQSRGYNRPNEVQIGFFEHLKSTKSLLLQIRILNQQFTLILKFTKTTNLDVKFMNKQFRMKDKLKNKLEAKIQQVFMVGKANNNT